MIPYLIALTCFLVGIVILVIAPRNLVDNFLFLAGFIMLFFAILNDPTFNNHPFFQHVFCDILGIQIIRIYQLLQISQLLLHL